MLFISLISVQKTLAAGENWLEGWAYRKSHIINPATGAGTNYQVLIYTWNSTGTDSGNNVTLGSHVLSANFGDVRFTDNDGSTLLDYWMESVNSTTASFWVEVADSLESAAQTIYVYYGNAEASDASNGWNTFSIFDDFDDGSYNTTTWSTASGTPVEADGYLRVCADDVYSVNTASLGSKLLSKARVSADVHGWMVIFINLSPLEYQGYFRDTVAGRLYVATADGTVTYSYETPLSTNTWMTLYTSWHASGGVGVRTDFNRDNIWMVSHTTNIPDLQPKARFLSYGSNPNLDVDWVAVGKYVYPEPAHGAWGEEEELEDTYYLNYSDISQNSTMLGTYTTFSVLWSSNGSLIDYVFEWNYSGPMTADSPVEWENQTSPQWSNITKELERNATKYSYEIQWRINATATGSENNTGIQSFTLSAVLVDFIVYPNGVLKINSTETSNSSDALYFPDDVLNSDALPEAEYSFIKFDVDDVEYTDNPSAITLTVSNYMEDKETDFYCVFGEGGALDRTRPEDLAGAMVATLILIPIAILFLAVLIRRKR